MKKQTKLPSTDLIPDWLEATSSHTSSSEDTSPRSSETLSRRNSSDTTSLHTTVSKGMSPWATGSDTASSDTGNSKYACYSSDSASYVTTSSDDMDMVSVAAARRTPSEVEIARDVCTLLVSCLYRVGLFRFSMYWCIVSGYGFG